MIQTLSVAAALLALQSAPEADASSGESASEAAPTELSQLPLEQAAAARCGVVFAMTEGLQQAGDARAKELPDIKSGNGREFFVRAMAKIMEDQGLDREAVLAMVAREVESLSSDEYARVFELMPTCLVMKENAGL